MTATEFAALRDRMAREYAAEHVAAGDWDPATADRRAVEETDRLLPHGVDTPGMLLLVAESTDGAALGHLWLAVGQDPEPDADPDADTTSGTTSGTTTGTGDRDAAARQGGWVYDIEIAPEHRGRGFGAALLDVAEREAAHHGLGSIGLNVFGANTVARHLYESAGYAVTAQQMRKVLPPAPPRGPGPPVRRPAGGAGAAATVAG